MMLRRPKDEAPTPVWRGVVSGPSALSARFLSGRGGAASSCTLLFVVQMEERAWSKRRGGTNIQPRPSREDSNILARHLAEMPGSASG